MDFDQQLIVRIKAFLNAHDLTDSETARELYHAFFEANNAAARRLVECDVLIQKKQKIEAVLLAQREPKLLEAIELLEFPERKALLDLVDLYDWPMPDAIDPRLTANVRAVLAEMEDLRPLLTEFRRIARTDMLEDKLHLLREIHRLDKDNPEWRLPLMEVENQYLSRLIAEAQKTIQTQDFGRLKEIHDELHRSPWLVTIPSIVMQKIDKLVSAHQLELDRQKAREILERIASAYSSFDVVALEDAVIRWNDHCRIRNYRPDEKELLQFNEANDYLNSEKQKLKDKQEFRRLLDQVTMLIDAGSSLDEVEKTYAAAEALGLEIPEHIANRAAQYRIDIERERRTAAVLKGCRVIGIAAVIIVVAVGAAIFTVQHLIERSQAANLRAAIRSGDVRRAQSLLRDIDRKYPKLAHRPRISQERAALNDLVEQEKRRVGELDKLLVQLDELVRTEPYTASVESSIKEKLNSARKLAKSSVERARVQERASIAQEKAGSVAEKNEDIFMTKVAAVNRLNKQVTEAVERGRRNGDFDQAKKLAEEVAKLCAEARDIPAIRENLLADYKNTLESGDTLFALISEAEARNRENCAVLQQLAAARNVAELSAAQDKLEAMAAASPEFAEMNRLLKRDIETMRALFDYQERRLSHADAAAAKSGFFADCRWLREYLNKTAAAKKKLVASFDSLQKNTNNRRVVFIRFKYNDAFLDVYAWHDKISVANNVFTLERVDGAQVKIVNYLYSCRVSIDGVVFANCKLLCPKEISSLHKLRRSRAPHQLLIESIFHKLPSVRDEDIFSVAVGLLRQIHDDPNCSPYWKMQLSLRILEAVAPLDITTDRTLADLLAAVEKLKNLDDGTTFPLYNKFLLEKISVFFDNYDRKKLPRAAEAQNVLLKLRRENVERGYRFLGVAVNINGSMVFSAPPDPGLASGDVWCLDPSGGGCVVVGRFDRLGLVLDDKYREYALGRLLFTTRDGENMMARFRQLENNDCGINVNKVVWPEFWPANIRGGDKR